MRVRVRGNERLRATTTVTEQERLRVRGNESENCVFFELSLLEFF